MRIRKELHVAMLVGAAETPVAWKVVNEARAIDRLRRKVERAAPGAVGGLLDKVLGGR